LRKIVSSIACVVGIVSLTFSFSAAAMAATVTLTVGAEPVESITTQLGATVSGASANARLWVNVKPAGGEGCAANPEADHGIGIIDDYYSPEQAPAYSDTANHTFDTAGSYLLCGWLTEPGNPPVVLASPSMGFAVRQPHLSLSISVPQQVAPEQTFQISMTAQAETTRLASEYLLPDTGENCPANAAAADEAPGAHEVLGNWNVTGGPLTETRNQLLTTVGTYWVCAYFEYPSTQAAPEFTASAQTVVLPPPLPCVVPSVTQKMKLATIERRIRSGHCTVGKVEHVPSKRVRPGSIIRLSPKPGTKLLAQAAVAIVISTGRLRRRGRRR
jgi:hypothetical protein